MRYFYEVLLVLIIIFASVFEAIPTFARSYELNPEVVKVVQNQIDKEKKFGYDNFSLVYVAEGEMKISLVYTATNSSLDPESRFLSGYMVSQSFMGEWIYVGSKTISYSDETDLESMKSCADGNVD